MQKYPRRAPVGFILKSLIIMEAGLFGVAYYVYHRMNTSRDFRRWMYEKNYSVLDGFYRLGEYFGDHRTRQNDFKIWGIKGKNE